MIDDDVLLSTLDVCSELVAGDIPVAVVIGASEVSESDIIILELCSELDEEVMVSVVVVKETDDDISCVELETSITVEYEALG